MRDLDVNILTETTARLLVEANYRIPLTFSPGCAARRYDFDPFAATAWAPTASRGGRSSDSTRFLVEEGNPYPRLPAVTADIDLYACMRELTLSANRANATVYTVDPRGLSDVVDAGQHLDQSEWRSFRRRKRTAADVVARHRTVDVRRSLSRAPGMARRVSSSNRPRDLM